MDMETEKVPRAVSIKLATALPYFRDMLGMEEVKLVEIMMPVLLKLRWQPMGLPRRLNFSRKNRTFYINC